MSELDFTALLDRVAPAVLSAGETVMRSFGSRATVELKADSSPVTEADRASERILLEALQGFAPDIPIICEEAASEGRVPKVDSAFFLIDPLDGTREFIAGRNEFTINVGLVVNGSPTFGVIFAPALAHLFLTTWPDRAVEVRVPRGAAWNDLRGKQHLSPMRTRRPEAGDLAALVSRSHAEPELPSLLEKLAVRSSRSLGSALKFCLIARGEADLYPRLGPTCEWDTAAGQAILEAAGGVVTALDGQPLTYGKAKEGFRNPGFLAWGRAPLAEW